MPGRWNVFLVGKVARKGNKARRGRPDGFSLPDPLLLVEGTPREMGEQGARLGVIPGQRILDYPKDLLRKYHLEPLWPLFVRLGTAPNSLQDALSCKLFRQGR